MTGTKAGLEIAQGTWRAKFDNTFGTQNEHVLGAINLPESDNKNEETKISHAENKSQKLKTKPKKAIFTGGPNWQNSLQVKSKKIDLSQDEDDMENQYVLPFELIEEEGENEVHVQGVYFEQETIELFIDCQTI